MLVPPATPIFYTAALKNLRAGQLGIEVVLLLVVLVSHTERERGKIKHWSVINFGRYKGKLQQTHLPCVTLSTDPPIPPHRFYLSIFVSLIYVFFAFGLLHAIGRNWDFNVQPILDPKDEKKKLIVLGDVWGDLNFNETGIPSGDHFRNCKILLTTRRVPVCESMNCRPKNLLDILTEDEAWALFKTAANLEDDSTALSNVAKRVAKECGRLPIAIVSVAKALRGKSLHGWERALTKLQEGEYIEIQDMSGEENAFKSLKFSFDELPREETKRCLLLCSLYPKDHEICVEDVSRYAFGLGLYQHAQSLKDNLSEVVYAIDELKDCHLLLEAGSKGHVKMHDLVRDVVLLIGKSYSAARESRTKKEFIVGGGVGFEEWPMDERFKDCAAISLLDNEIGRLLDQLDSPRLEILLLARRTYGTVGYSSSGEEFTNILDKSFQGMEKLRVLSLTRGILSIQSLECLTSLRTLELRYCKLADLASLQNLKTLEILSFFGSDVGELPEEIGELKNLELLELNDCYIERIPSNLVRNLFKLEELHIGLYEGWEESTDNASLMELNSLQHLTTLSVTPRNVIPENFVLSKNLTEYHIHICDCEYPSFPSRLRHPASRTICFIPTEETIRICKELFSNVYDLRMDYNPGRFKNMMPDMSEVGFQDLSRLDIHGYELECLVSFTKQKKMAAKAFSNLVELNINFVGSMREICDGLPPEGFLEKLQKLMITECDKMITIFPAKLLRGMQKLESVKIEECQNLQDVFQLDGVEDAKKECLSHLTTLELKYMDALICIWKGPTHHVNLRSLTSLTLWDCGSLKSVISPSLAYSLERLEKLDIESCGQLEHIISEKDEDGKETFSKTHSQQACLQNLKEVQIEDCKKLEYVFPMSIVQGLLYLEVLKISDAAQLMQVFGNEDGNIFSYPTELEFRDSSKVGYLFSRNCAVVLPTLRHVEIHKCPQLLIHSVLRIPPKVSTNSERLTVADTESISLEILDLEGCSQLECIISKEDDYDIENKEISLNTPFLPVCFTSLKKIQIVDCNKLKMLLPITVARGLPHLTELHIQASSQLVAIFGSEDQADINNIEEIVLPELLKLHLEQLPSLISFCPKEYHLVFPSLEMLRVKTCPEMTTSFSAATDAYVHAKSEALTRDTAIGSATTQIIVAPHSNGSDWIRLEGKWMSKEKAEERRRI